MFNLIFCVVVSVPVMWRCTRKKDERESVGKGECEKVGKGECGEG